MFTVEKKDKNQQPNSTEVQYYVDFLYQHLEQYGDKREDIKKALDYALSIDNKPGGFILTAKDEQSKIVGIAVILNTLMSGFIPDHILVYIATDSKVRGKGIGSLLMDQLKKECSGAIALHVEESNPAQFLYEKKGFEKKYIEMRLNR
jgi:ribosomal protein S18 acetylase RimI-like enzyme